MDPRHINNLWANALLRTFADLNLDVPKLGKGMKGIESGRLAAGCQLDLIDARTLWHRAVRESQSRLLGIDVGMRLSLRSTGLLFPLLLHSPSVRTALELLTRYQSLISENGSFRLIKEGADAAIRYEYIPAHSSVAVHPQHVLSVLTATLMSLSLITEGACKVRSLRLPAGMDLDAISGLLHCHVIAEDDRFLLELEEEGLDALVVGRDEHLYQLLLGYADGLLRAKTAGQGFLDYIKSCMDSDRLVQVDIDTLAREVGMKKRTLQRHLDEQGTSFRALKEGLLKETVLELLVVRKRSISEIAESLGYADVSTFHRAFKAWFGVTPRQFKSQIGS